MQRQWEYRGGSANLCQAAQKEAGKASQITPKLSAGGQIEVLQIEKGERVLQVERIGRCKGPDADDG